MRDPLRDAFEKYRSGEPLVPEARALLRWGVGFVFLWFGIDKFVNPGYWPMWIPTYLPMLRTPEAIAAFGVFEVLVGLALVANFRVREASAAATMFLAGVIATNGVAVVVRDVGLLAATLYLALTTRGPSPARSPAPARGPAAWRISARSRAIVGAVVAFLLLIGVVAAAVQLSDPDRSPSASGPLLVIETPQDGAEVPRGDLPVTVRVVADGRPLANHVHFKVDGRVMDAVFLRDGETTATTTLRGLSPGSHTIEAYLAYADHVEHPGSRAAVTIAVRA